MFILTKGQQPGVYVPLRALFLVFIVYYVFVCFILRICYKYIRIIICITSRQVGV